MAGWLAGWLAERLAALPSPPSLPHINQGLSERSIVGAAVRSFSFRPSLDGPTDRDRDRARPACSLPLLARRGQEISHTISEAAVEEEEARGAIFLSRPPSSPPLLVS